MILIKSYSTTGDLMASSDVHQAWAGHKGVEAWATDNVHIFIIAIDLNINSLPRSIFNQPIGLIIPVQGMLVDEFRTRG